MSPKKKKPSLPKVRHTWKIRPATRVKLSAKIYSRANHSVPDDPAADRRSTDWRRADAKKKPSWVNDVDWFGDE
jgi:hypothetical protein